MRLLLLFVSPEVTLGEVLKPCACRQILLDGFLMIDNLVSRHLSLDLDAFGVIGSIGDDSAA